MNKYKKIVGSVMLFALAVKMLLAPAIFLNYELRKDFIIKNYCVNKNRPELHCDGKCYLAQELKKAEQQDEKQATDTFLSKLFGIEIFQNNTTQTVFFRKNPFLEEKTSNYFYLDRAISTGYTSIFHPPRI
jgi:hypothetical protein